MIRVRATFAVLVTSTLLAQRHARNQFAPMGTPTMEEQPQLMASARSIVLNSMVPHGIVAMVVTAVLTDRAHI